MISKNKAEGLTLPAIETYSKATIILRVLVKNEKKKKWSYGTEERALAHTRTYKWIYDKSHNTIGKDGVFKKEKGNGAESIWTDMRKNEDWSLNFIQIIKLLEETMEKYLLALG